MIHKMSVETSPATRRSSEYIREMMHGHPNVGLGQNMNDIIGGKYYHSIDNYEGSAKGGKRIVKRQPVVLQSIRLRQGPQAFTSSLKSIGRVNTLRPSVTPGKGSNVSKQIKKI